MAGGLSISALAFMFSFSKPLRREPENQNDQWKGFAFSLFVHIGLLFAGGLLLIKPVDFGVDEGLSGMEVQLVAGSDEPVVLPVVQEIKPEVIEELPKNIQEAEILKEPVKTLEPVKMTTAGNSAFNAISTSQGAQTEIKASYLRNPAPRYPFEARQKGWQGTVLLMVAVNKAGDPIKVEIKSTSGHKILDEAAVKTIKTWSFRPAHFGNMPVESVVEVPVRFDIEKSL